MRREIPLAITAIVGFALIIVYFIPHPPFNHSRDFFEDLFFIIAAFAIWLGCLNLLKVNADKIYRQKKGWLFSVVVWFGFFLMVIVGFWEGRGFMNPGTTFYYLYDILYYPLNATMFSILAFFVASASYRAFRARNKEATILLIAALFVMLGRVPFGYYLSTWLPEGWRLGNITDWIMDFPQTAAQRAIMIGIALGIVSSSLRVLLGLERTFASGE